jgi:hypothetical protein
MECHDEIKSKGESMVVRRFITVAFSFCLVLAFGIAQVDHLFAQDAVKKAAVPPPQAPPDAAKTPAKTEQAKPAEPAKPQDTTKAEPAKPVEPPQTPIPPQVQAKIDAARKAVAEMIVAAQDAGLVETSIDPPPILDILITGRATDGKILKGKKPANGAYGLSPEVMGAWFTGYGKMEGINYVDDVRIVSPSDGLKQWYDQRAQILEKYIQEIRKTKGPAPAPKADTKPATPPKAAAPSTDAPKTAPAAATPVTKAATPK